MVKRMSMIGAALLAAMTFAATSRAGPVVETGYDVSHPGNFAITGGGTATDISMTYYLGAGATITSAPVISSSVAGTLSTISPITSAGAYTIELYNFNVSSMRATPPRRSRASCPHSRA